MKEHAIAQAFSDAAFQYEDNAAVQHQVAEHLINNIEQLQIGSVICDLGCGPGSCYSLLQSKFANSSLDYTGIDIAQGMLDQAKSLYPKAQHPKTTWHQANMQQLPFADKSIDLVISSSSMQWLDQLEPTFTEVKRVLTPSGSFQFSLYIDGTLANLKNAFAAIDQQPHVNSFFTQQQVIDALERSGFTVSSASTKSYKQSFSSALELMRSLKQVGANTVKSRDKARPLTRARLKQLEQQLTAQQGEPVYAEYNTLFIDAQIS
jgi:malonyl-CoA O-methyltransferase